MNDRYVDSPPAGPDAWREVWESNVRYRPRRGRLLAWLQGIFRRVGATEFDRQKDFNLALLALLQGVRDDIANLREDFKRDLSALQLDVRQADEALAAEVARARDLLPIASRRNDALVAALDQKVESVAARLRDLTNPNAGPTPSAASPDFIYRRLEDALRGAPDVAPYVDFAREHHPVIDIGCGRGEFLIACRDAKIEARGFDVNERSVADLKERGIDVTLAGVPECFEGIHHDSIGSILAMHVVEHLPVDALLALFANASRILRRGGLLMIETPNAESLLVSASEFWRDPTHIAPRHPAALTLLGREHGFAIEEIRPVHPFPEGNQLPIAEDDSPTVQRIVGVINERLFGPQDVRLVLKRS